MSDARITVPLNHVSSDGERVWVRLMLIEDGQPGFSVVVELTMNEAADFGRRLLEPPVVLVPSVDAA